MKQDNLELFWRSLVLPAALVAGFTTGGCREYTCQDTATCTFTNSDGGNGDAASSTGTTGDQEAKPTSEVGTSSVPEATEPSETSQASASSGSEEPTPATEADASVDTTPLETTSFDTSADGGIAPEETNETTSNNGETIESEEGQTTVPDETSETVPEPRCDPEKPFGRPFALTTINLEDVVENVMLSPNGLTMHIRYGADTTTYTTARSGSFGDFGTPQPSSAFGGLLEQEPTLRLRSITEDALTAYLSSDTWGEPIHSAHRDSMDDDFEQLTVHDELKAFDIALADPWITPNGDRLYGFLPAAYTIWASDWENFGFGAPFEVVEANGSSVFEGTDQIVLSSSETVLYFTTNSLDNESFDSPTIVRAERAGLNDQFGGWEVMTSLAGGHHDAPLWVSDDDCEIILEQQRQVDDEPPTYTSDIFIARRGL